ncbi:2-dehydro-3-deoxy-D-arabinonate dehydratase [Nakamurella panacisegetis]|uniref:2-dehydro-3-deoxy-D-arabinonate dehydratase n=1 Tax=Nakamurella panacisegetis TaxID=1090615 RepID=A0A1H0R924_9ACTN|nr:fumarylacetoacetate hydrolase family protein [Nakamurella panacisegetis]SDP25984.1 2-dehydro-3-deoxy-D-arabinonate dehydratase [Nakamurella panacisegetis]
MNIVRFRRPDAAPEVGVLSDGLIRPIRDAPSLAHLWQLTATELRERLTSSPGIDGVAIDDVALLAPVDGRTEVWACGVTYETSRAARIEESDRAADVYALVYDAERPELFFKSVAWRASGPGAPIGVRVDSTLDVPEPELAAVVNRYGEIVGWTICNDVSSRSIEGENPLYLPQAKVFSGACGLGPWVTPWWEVPDPYRLSIHLDIQRDGVTTWTGEANTSALHRRIDDLVGYLFRGDVHPDGAVLSTGTCLVPAAPFSLQHGDVVTIEIPGVGSLTNPVVRGFVGAEAS